MSERSARDELVEVMARARWERHSGLPGRVPWELAAEQFRVRTRLEASRDVDAILASPHLARAAGWDTERDEFLEYQRDATTERDGLKSMLAEAVGLLHALTEIVEDEQLAHGCQDGPHPEVAAARAFLATMESAK